MRREFEIRTNVETGELEYLNPSHVISPQEPEWAPVRRVLGYPFNKETGIIEVIPEKGHSINNITLSDRVEVFISFYDEGDKHICDNLVIQTYHEESNSYNMCEFDLLDGDNIWWFYNEPYSDVSGGDVLYHHNFMEELHEIITIDEVVKLTSEMIRRGIYLF